MPHPNRCQFLGTAVIAALEDRGGDAQAVAAMMRATLPVGE
jgi:hypothetical protein